MFPTLLYSCTLFPFKRRLFPLLSRGSFQLFNFILISSSFSCLEQTQFLLKTTFPLLNEALPEQSVLMAMVHISPHYKNTDFSNFGKLFQHILTSSSFSSILNLTLITLITLIFNMLHIDTDLLCGWSVLPSLEASLSRSDCRRFFQTFLFE